MTTRERIENDDDDDYKRGERKMMTSMREE